jgi:Glycosidases
MLENVKFWLQKGVDGFRLDIFNSLYEDSLFRNNPVSLNVLTKFQQPKYTANLPACLRFAEELRNVCDSFGEKMLLGEIIGNRSTTRTYCGVHTNNRLTQTFNFEMLRFRFSARYFEKLITDMERDFPAPFMPVYVFSNHDRRRMLSRLKGNINKAKLVHAVQMLARGVPCLYYGEEIGMTDSKLPYKNSLDPLPRHLKIPRALVNLANETLNRDDMRTPMQWNANRLAGFTTADTPWLPVHRQYTKVNVAEGLRDSSSLLHFIRLLLTQRKPSTNISRKRNVLYLNGAVLNFHATKQVKALYHSTDINRLYNSRGKITHRPYKKSHDWYKVKLPPLSVTWVKE